MGAVYLILAMLLVIGCASHTHIVGRGAQGNQTIEARQWYILFGLIPLNDVNTTNMSAGATDYTITTESSVVDVLINIFTSYVTVSSRTVTVTK